MSDNEAKQATTHETLIANLLDSRVPKNEREHAAAREILGLRTKLAACREAADNFEADYRVENRKLEDELTRLRHIAVANRHLLRTLDEQFRRVAELEALAGREVPG